MSKSKSEIIVLSMKYYSVGTIDDNVVADAAVASTATCAAAVAYDATGVESIDTESCAV